MREMQQAEAGTCRATHTGPTLDEVLLSL